MSRKRDRSANPRDAMNARWRTLKNRCRNPNATAYRWYGGRGIDVCDKWANSFQAFLDDVGMPPSKKHSLDRIDNTKGYEPGNVRWATPQQQADNSTKPRYRKYERTRNYIAEMDDTYKFMLDIDEQ